APPLDPLSFPTRRSSDLQHHLAEAFGTAGGLARQGFHLLGHHGEAAADLAGAGGLDGGIEGEQGGLEGDVLVGHAEFLDIALDVVDQVVDLQMMRMTGHGIRRFYCETPYPMQVACRERLLKNLPCLPYISRGRA